MSKVVFVGNVPYNYGEEQLIEVFKSVGQVVGFRLVFDRDTGKPKGYGFCEFADHETAQSAVRNLNSVEVGGRPLRIDLADSDPFLEGKTTVRGELVDGNAHAYSGFGGGGGGVTGGGVPGGFRGNGSGGPGKDDGPAFLRGLPAGISVPPGTSVLDAISQALASMNPTQLVEVLAQMKAFVITHPDQARVLLVNHPQLAYALFQALVLNKIVDPTVLQRMLGQTGAPPAAPTPPIVNVPAAPAPFPPPTPVQQSGFYPTAAPPAPPPQQQQQQQQQVPSPFYGSVPPPQIPRMPALAPTPGATAIPPTGLLDNLNVPPEHKAMLLQVLTLTPEQVAQLGPTERETIMTLRQSLGIAS
ncbi:hypothetical protein K488DRAFT_75631 [Vararia minispora EC-137]|uniref:Uncharacterized protein n=1 Tax=Vararia minispora EC-137 TaxID=1314806 RepID=A0ACB8QZK6_9AGAM|nr:hypothetical protein K488DRAFT_75631 [Vararia minispora EC-137]